MGVLFISHSRQDNEAAVKVRDWLKSHGWKDVFLDLDPEQGMAVGRAWQQELKQAGERCSGVLVLLSPDWVASYWCRTEFLVADQLGKKIFPVIVAPMLFEELPAEFQAKFQMVDISSAEKEREGLTRLAIGLKRAGLDPTSFEWPPPSDPHRLIYRGLQSLDEKDAAIFFGRDVQITESLDALRRIRNGEARRMFVILGASGAGKSSFLKAGLIARLKRDEENFLVLPVIRPERAMLSGAHGLAAALSCAPAQLKTSRDIQNALAQLRASVTDRLRRFAERAHETVVVRPPTIVIPIDQAEELFMAEDTEAAHALELLVPAILEDADTIIVATIRSDAFARMQEEPRLADVHRLPFDLAPIPRGAIKEVIEGPARLAEPPLTVEPALTEQLLKDLATDDALPLLAFTLERLLRRCPGKRTLALADYVHEMGGLQGAILAAVDEAFVKARHDPSLPNDNLQLEKLARAAFIPGLVRMEDAESEPKRRLERAQALPRAATPLIRHFIDARLLISDRRAIGGVEFDTIEVAHEAILRQWPALRSWISDERDALRALDGVRAAAREWQVHKSATNHGKSWLVHGGGRLEEVEQLLAPAHFANALQAFERDYLGACRARDNAERERERNEIEREKKSIARTKRLQRNIFALIGAAVATVLIAGFGLVGILRGIAVRSSDALANLSEQASDRQNYEEAARYAIAGLAGADSPIVGFSAARAVRALVTADMSSRRIAIMGGSAGFVISAVYSPDGRRIVTTSEDRTARIWDAATGKELTVLRGHEDAVMGASYSPDGRRIVTASQDRTARVWDAGTGKELAVLRGHDGTVNSAAYSPDGTRIVTASRDKMAHIWDAANGKELAVLHGPDFVTNAAYSPDGKRIVTSFADNTARVWDASTGRELAVLSGHDDIINTAAYSPDGTRIVTASDDKTARIWDASAGKQLTVLRGHDEAVTSAGYSPEGTLIVTASADGTARIWDAATGKQLAVLSGPDGVVSHAAYSPDGSRIVTASSDTARIWAAATSTELAALRGHDFVSSAAFSPDGRRVVTGSNDKTAVIWDSATGAQLTVLRGHTGAVANASYSHNGKRIVTASQDRTARIWDSTTGKQLAVMRGHVRLVYSAVYSPDDRHVVTASNDRTIRIWDAATGAKLAVLRGYNGIAVSAAYSPDGRRIVTACEDGVARVWNAATGRLSAVLSGHESFVTSAAYSPDGRRIVTASADKTARIWDAATGAELAVLRGHRSFVNSAAYSPDGRRIVTASDDRTARIWDVATGIELAVIRGHDDIFAAAYSPDGRRILTTSGESRAGIWAVPKIDESLLHLSRAALIARTCATLLSGSLDHFSSEEMRAAPDLDPALDANACHPPSFWTRLRRLVFAAASR